LEDTVNRIEKQKGESAFPFAWFEYKEEKQQPKFKQEAPDAVVRGGARVGRRRAPPMIRQTAGR
jgi:hypothetical protein